MHTIQVSVRDKIATQTDGTVIINGNSDYIIEFDFDAEWADLNNKVGIFAFNDAAAHKWAYQTVMFSGNSCTVPILRDIHCVYVGVTAGNVRVTTPAKVQCRLSISDYADTEEPPSADVWGQILAKLDELQTEIDEIKAGGGGGTDISLGVTATVGQTIKVKAVDANGKPTAWEAVDMATGEAWETLAETTLEEESVPILDIGAMASSFRRLRFYLTFPIVASVEKVYVSLAIPNSTTGPAYNVALIKRGNDKSESWAFIDFFPLLYNGICYMSMIESAKVGITYDTTQQFQYNSYDYYRISEARYVRTSKPLPTGTTLTILGVRK